MSATPESYAEQAVILALQAEAALSALNIKAHASEDDAETPSISVSGAPGETQLDGPGGVLVSVTIVYRELYSVAEATTDAIAKAIRDALDAPAGSLPAGLSGAWFFTEEISGDREDTKTLRKRTLELPVQVVTV